MPHSCAGLLVCATLLTGCVTQALIERPASWPLPRSTDCTRFEDTYQNTAVDAVRNRYAAYEGNMLAPKLLLNLVASEAARSSWHHVDKLKVSVSLMDVHIVLYRSDGSSLAAAMDPEISIGCASGVFLFERRKLYTAPNVTQGIRYRLEMYQAADRSLILMTARAGASFEGQLELIPLRKSLIVSGASIGPLPLEIALFRFPVDANMSSRGDR